MCTAMINLLYFTLCSAMFFKHGQLSNIPSLVIFGVQTILLCFTFVKFGFDPYPFGYFRFSFRPQTLAMEHYLIKILILIMTVLLIVLLPNLYFVHPIPLALMLLYILINRPYKLPRENARAVLNWLIMLSFTTMNIVVNFYSPVSP